LTRATQTGALPAVRKVSSWPQRDGLVESQDETGHRDEKIIRGEFRNLNR